MKAALTIVIVFFLRASAAAQTTNVFIWDSSGNQVTGSISNGNLYFHDSSGNVTSGTVRNGNVFLNTGKGEITFGTVRDGHVFLTDSNGITTGTIRNGNIFLSNSDVVSQPERMIIRGTFTQIPPVVRRSRRSR